MVGSAIPGDARVRDESSNVTLYLCLFVRLRGIDRYRSAAGLVGSPLPSRLNSISDRMPCYRVGGEQGDKRY